MTKRYDIVIKDGEYTDSNGETKARWVTLGAVMQGDKGFYALLNPGVNLAAYKEEGQRSVIASLFEPKPRENQQQTTPQQQPAASAPDFDDDIPF